MAVADEDQVAGSPGAPQPLKAGFGKQQIIATIVTLVVLVIVFAVVLPQLGDYDKAWTAIQGMSTAWIVALLVATTVVIVVYVWPYQAALPGLRYGAGFVVRQTSFLISNAIPGGGALGLGVQYSMLSGYGFGPAETTSAIGITSVWNTLVTLTLPLLAVVGLVLTGVSSGEATAAALIGFAIVLAVIVVFAVMLASEDVARRIGGWGDRLVRWVAGLFRKEVDLDLAGAVVRFRNSIVDVVAQRWLLITVTNVLQQLTQFAVLWIALLAVQGGASAASLVEAFAAYAFARLLSFVPVTPGGLGTVDAALTAILQGFGVPANPALAAVLVWRAATYFPQILIGIVTFLVWRRGARRSAPAEAR